MFIFYFDVKLKAVISLCFFKQIIILNIVDIILQQKPMQKQDENWLPLESNPEVMSKFLVQLGFNGQKYAVHDVLSIQEWAHQMIPKPVFGVVFLYQINKAQKQYSKEEQESVKPKVSENVYFMKQYAKNACGTIALFHILMNQIQRYPDLITQESFLMNFFIETLQKKPEERGEIFQSNKSLRKQHKKSVKQGKTQVREKVETHFIAFIQKDGCLYELDGNKKNPVNHGQCTPQGLLMMSTLIIQQFMNRDPTNNQFTILALASKE